MNYKVWCPKCEDRVDVEISEFVVGAFLDLQEKRIKELEEKICRFTCYCEMQKFNLYKLEEKLKIAVETLEYYADKKSWNCTNWTGDEPSLVDHSDEEEIEDLALAGKRARHALKQIKEDE